MYTHIQRAHIYLYMRCMHMDINAHTLTKHTRAIYIARVCFVSVCAFISICIQRMYKYICARCICVYIQCFVCMHVCVYMRLHIHITIVHIYHCIYSTCVFAFVRACMCVYSQSATYSACAFACVRLRVYVHIHIQRIHICVRVCISQRFVCTHIQSFIYLAKCTCIHKPMKTCRKFSVRLAIKGLLLATYFRSNPTSSNTMTIFYIIFFYLTYIHFLYS